ncbi:hypothetical protein Trydic_g6446 [Trypoxylus dichotomus]
MWMIPSSYEHTAKISYKISSNNIHPRIKYTMNIENRNQLLFLDVLVIKKQDGTLGKDNSYQPLPQCAITPPSRTVTRSGENPSVKILTVSGRQSHSSREQRG